MNDPNNLVACPLPILDDCSKKNLSSYNNVLVLGNKAKDPKHQNLAATNKLGVGVFKADDDTNASKNKAIEEEKSKKDESEKRNDWRNMPSCDMDWMIIVSYGDQFDPSIEASYKEQQDNPSNNRVMLARKEMEAVLDVCIKDEGMFLKYVCPDFPGIQFTKEEHIERIKQIMLSSEKEGVLLWYTGHGEKDTGNWCFRDGVISFQDVFGLYMDHMRGKRLTIVCDCSYSGKWIKQCAEKLDEIGIPACGHHAKDQGILLKIFPSCKANEKASINCFTEEAIFVSDGSLRFRCKTLTSGQTSVYGDFRGFCCSSESGPCDVLSKWCDRLIRKNQLFKVTGKDRGLPAWHYLLVDEDKLDEYNALFRDGARPRVDVAKYGKVLQSGWGKNPPEDVIDKFGAYYTEY